MGIIIALNDILIIARSGVHVHQSICDSITTLVYTGGRVILPNSSVFLTNGDV